MRIVTVLSVAFAIASAADYNTVDPAAAPAASYVADKPAPAPYGKPADLALILKLLAQLPGYGAKYADSEDDSYAPSYPDLTKLLKLLLPKKPALKAAYTVLNRLPGLYGALPPYALNPALLGAAYRPHPLGLLPPYAPHPLNLLYPPAPAGYHLPLPPAAYPLPPAAYPLAPKLPAAGLYGLPGYAPPAYGLPPLIVITKDILDALKADDYADEVVDVPAVEVAAPAAYVPKPKKVVAKVVASPAAYVAPKAAVLVKAVKAKPYAKAVKVVKVPKAYAAAVVKPAKVYAVTAAPALAAYAAADVPAAVVPAETVYEEARSAGDAESKVSSKVESSVKKVDSASPASSADGESARSSLTDQGISSQQTISRIS